ncbi:hypothetical protein ACFFKC_08555 [Pseudoduganella danionis]|uniref:Radical SAM protein n=1 Tax=Pseudoduganella danionis TaxID=1890295 RepID=A0ABW9SVM9_9BURK|nr:hypothetical protein [Pseudoduganella danionis]MTW34872.1 hypothetical protein [Pseudoduganella danionis]
MRKPKPNFTIIVNWKTKGFGCSKNCCYCNWRDSPLLPHGPQSREALNKFVAQCDKSFITISGGADPLFRFEENLTHLLSMIRIIKNQDLKVRIITREVQHIAKLRGIVDHFSISLDADVLDAIQHYRHEWDGMDIEYSLVLPPLPTADIATLKPQYLAIYRRLGQRLVLRENLNSIFPLDLAQLTFGHSGIVFVRKALCLSSRYLSTVDCTGYEMMQDTEQLATYLMNEPSLHLFGGITKHLINPKQHPEFSDIDVVASSAHVMRQLENEFSFTFRDVSSSSTSYPRYLLGKSTRAGKTIQLILVNSSADIQRFIRAAQYDADRVSFSAGRFHFDSTIGEPAIRHAINSKQVRPVGNDRDLSLCSINRPAVEQRHKIKLLRKGFTIHE